ncbi:MAG: hypothetical protein QW727_00325 [Candidatus Pacearchaeota archaeon]
MVIFLALILFVIADNFYSNDVRLSSEISKEGGTPIGVSNVEIAEISNVVDDSKVLEEGFRGRNNYMPGFMGGESAYVEVDDSPKQQLEIIFASNKCEPGFEKCGNLCCEKGSCDNIGSTLVCNPTIEEHCTLPNTDLCQAKDLNMCCHPTDKCGVQRIGPPFFKKEIAICLPEDVDACKQNETPCGKFIEIEGVNGPLCCPEGSFCKKIGIIGDDIYFCTFKEKSCTDKGLIACKGEGKIFGEVMKCCNPGECKLSSGGQPYCAHSIDSSKPA